MRSMAEAVSGLDEQQLKLLGKYGSAVEDITRNLAGEEDNKCLTPLHLACIKGHAEAAEALMSFGINPFAMVGKALGNRISSRYVVLLGCCSTS